MGLLSDVRDAINECHARDVVITCSVPKIDALTKLRDETIAAIDRAEYSMRLLRLIVSRYMCMTTGQNVLKSLVDAPEFHNDADELCCGWTHYTTDEHGIVLDETHRRLIEITEREAGYGDA